MERSYHDVILVSSECFDMFVGPFYRSSHI